MKMTRLLFEAMIDAWIAGGGITATEDGAFQFAVVTADFDPGTVRLVTDLHIDSVHCIADPTGTTGDDPAPVHEVEKDGVAVLPLYAGAVDLQIGDLDGPLTIFGFALVNGTLGTVVASERFPSPVPISPGNKRIFLTAPRFFFPASMVS